MISSLRNRFYLLFLLLFMVGKVFAQPAWNYTVTGTNHTILIPVSALQDLYAAGFSQGDYIGVFYQNQGTLECGGYMQWQGQTNTIAAWGTNPGLNNGFAVNEKFKWKVFIQSLGLELDCNAIYNLAAFPNDSLYMSNGLSGLESLGLAEDLPLPEWIVDTTTIFEKLWFSFPDSVLLNNSLLAVHSFIGAFYDSSGVEKCCGILEWKQQTDTLLIYGASPGLDNGYQENESLSWKFWDYTTQNEVPAQTTYDSSGTSSDGLFHSGALSGIQSMKAHINTDVGITQLLSPMESCDNLDSNQVITLELFNYGNTDIQEMEIVVQCSQLSIQDTFYVSSLFQALSPFIFTIPSFYDLSLFGSYSFSFQLHVTGDENPQNDLLSISIEHNNLPTVDFLMYDTIYCSSADSVIHIQASPSGGYFTGLNVVDSLFLLFEPGIFPVVYHYTDPASLCLVRDTITFEVLASPQFEFPSLLNACEGDSVCLTGPSGDYSYQWSDGSSTQQICVDQNGSYSLVVTASNSCQTSSESQVLIFPVPDFTISGPEMSCQGETAELTIPSGFDLYAWMTDLPGMQTNYTVTQTGNYYAKVWENGCSATDTFFIEFFVPDSVQIIGPEFACKGEVVELEAIGDFEYFIWPHDIFNYSAQSFVSESGSYTVSGVDEHYCQSMDSFEVTFLAYPEMIFDDYFHLCSDDSVFLNPGKADNYLWSTGDTSAGIWVNQSGMYSLTSNNNICYREDSIQITFFDVPECRFDVQVLFNEVEIINRTGPAEYYLWTLPDGRISYDFEPHFILPETGSYTIKLEAGNFCGWADTIQTFHVNDLIDNRPVHEIHTYPNPSNGWFSALIPCTQNIRIGAELYNSEGRLLKAFNAMFLTSGLNVREFSIHNLSAGQYYIRWTYQDMEQISKITIKK